MSDPALNVEATTQIAHTLASPYAPVISPDKFNISANSDPDTLVQVFMQAKPLASLERPSPGDTNPPDPATLSVMLKFCEWIPQLHLVPAQLVEEHTLEFHWAKIRCIFAGVGYKYHAHMARACQRLYPQCPLSDRETYDDWYGAALKARNTCGWPLTFSVTPWKPVFYSLSNMDPAKDPVTNWQRAFAVLHLLKHVRTSYRFGTVAIFDGRVISIEANRRSNVLLAKGDIALMCQTLGAPGAGSKEKNPLTATLAAALGSVTVTQILERQPTHQLPAQILHGAWTTYAQDPSANSSFIQHGCTLRGIWIASGGVVREARDHGLETEDIIGYDWSLTTLTEDEVSGQQEFENALVPTYDTTRWPSEILLDACPNVNWTSPDHRDLLDALLLCGVVRAEVPELAREKPLLVVLPTKPNVDDSTKQGKSACAHALMRSMVLDVPEKNIGRDQSAPAQRSIADGIIRRGTVYLDEWRLDPSPTAFLSKDNIQTLCTGGSVNGARVMENKEVNVILRQFMTASAKALNVPPDILNRTVTIYLDNLTDDQFNNAKNYDECKSGRLSLRLRLAAIGKAEQYQLAHLLQTTAIHGSRHGSRFLRHRLMAALIHQARTGKTLDASYAAIDMATQCMDLALTRHTADADANGLLSMMESNVVCRTRLSAVFGDMDGGQANAMQKYLQIISGGAKAGASVGQLLRARAEVAGTSNRPLGDMFRMLSGASAYARMSDRAIVISVGKEMLGSMPNPGDRYPFPDLAGLCGWVIERQANYNTTPMYRVFNVIQAHSSNTQPQTPNPLKESQPHEGHPTSLPNP